MEKIFAGCYGAVALPLTGGRYEIGWAARLEPVKIPQLLIN
jgi:hypothetical protein